MPLEIVRNDITKMKVDAIVNAANETLLGGGGVDGCIHRAAGPELLAECRTLGGCKTGDAKITKAYRLPCQYVIHTVGPVWNGGSHGERELLVSCYRTSLALAKEHGCETVAFPLISSGVFGYPKDQALRVAVDTISEFLAENDMTVYLVVFSRAAYQIGNKLFADIAAYIDDHYVDAHTDTRRERMRRMGVVESRMLTAYEDAPMAVGGLDEALAHLDAGFSETLLKFIDRSGKKDAEVYKKANVDRKLFSIIRNNPDYKPSKSTAIAFAIALGIVSVSRLFAPIFWGEDFAPCAYILSALALSIPFSGFANVIRMQYLIPNGMDGAYILSVILGAVSNLTANSLLIPRCGALGAAVGTVIAEGVVCAAQCLAVKKRIDILAYLKSTAFFGMAGLLMYGAVRVLDQRAEITVSWLLLEIIVGGSVYCILSVLYLYHTKNELLMTALQKLGGAHQNNDRG